jgi:hypothetical protein
VLASALFQLLVDAFRKIPTASWNAKERFSLLFTHSSISMFIRYSLWHGKTWCLLLIHSFQNNRIWMFPPSSLSIAEGVLDSVHGLTVEVTVIICNPKKLWWCLLQERLFDYFILLHSCLVG